MTSPAITDEQLLAYASGELTGEDARRVEGFISSSPAAARIVALYRLAASRTREDDTVAPPAEALVRAKGVFDPGRFAAPRRPGLADQIREVVARLIYDSRLQPAAVRYAGGEGRIQLSFETDAADVDLLAERLEAASGSGAAERWRLTGQLGTGDGPTPFEVALHREGEDEPILRRRSDDRGMFTMDIEGGRYELHLSASGARILLPHIELP